jgi:hypothetical protein
MMRRQEVEHGPAEVVDITLATITERLRRS